MREGRCPLGDEAMFRLAVDHGVAAALAAWAIERGDPVPPLWRDRLRQVRAQQLRHKSALDDLLNRLQLSGTQWMVARGWARTVDPILPVRPMGDVDLYTSHDQLSKLSEALMPRWQWKYNLYDPWTTTRVFVDQEGDGPAVDIHFDFSFFGQRCPGAMERALERRRRVEGLWLPDLETDWIIALIESLQSLRQRSLRRQWELEGLGHRLAPRERRNILMRFGLSSELLYQLEKRLYRVVPQAELRNDRLEQGYAGAAASWLKASDSRFATAAWLLRPLSKALWVRCVGGGPKAL